MDFKPLGDARAHYWKVVKMADAVGVPLVAAWDAGQLTSQDHAAMIHRCRGCSGVAACGRLLAGQPQLAVAPAYCENNDTFAGLKADLSAG